MKTQIIDEENVSTNANQLSPKPAGLWVCEITSKCGNGSIWTLIDCNTKKHFGYWETEDEAKSEAIKLLNIKNYSFYVLRNTPLMYLLWPNSTKYDEVTRIIDAVKHYLNPCPFCGSVIHPVAAQGTGKTE
jgi:L-rhamnose mutarotase